jgi:thiosulfate/3-mercaptopyruvate sulfurtransferase
MKRNLCWAIAILLSIATAAQAGYPRGDLLIEPADLARLPQPARILDARPRVKYQAGHIHGAIWIDHAAWSSQFNTIQEAEAWAGKIGSLGIDPETTVIVYDDNSSKDAARIWWILRYWGIEHVRLLNGGWLAWQKSGGRIQKEEPPNPIRDLKVASHPDRLATKGELVDLLRTKDYQIIDARSAGEHCGSEKLAKRAGSIPGAINLEWIEVIDTKTQRFKSAEELAQLFQRTGIRVDKPVVTHCQSGGRAAVMAFALELMGANQVRNYYKSWAEWGNAGDTPIVTPGAKK